MIQPAALDAALNAALIPERVAFVAAPAAPAALGRHGRAGGVVRAAPRGLERCKGDPPPSPLPGASS